MAKRNRIQTSKGNGLVNESSHKTVNSLTRMFDSKSGDPVEPPRATPSHKPLPPTPLKHKSNPPTQSSSPFAKRPSQNDKSQSNHHPPTPPTKPSKSHSIEAQPEIDESKDRLPLIPPASPKHNDRKKALCASTSNPDMPSEDRTKYSPPSRIRGLANRFRHRKGEDSSKATKNDVKAKSPKTHKRGAAGPATSVSNKAQLFVRRSSEETLAASCFPALPHGKPRGRMGSDDEKPSRSKKALIPVKVLQGEEPSAVNSWENPLPRPKHSPPLSRTAEYDEVAAGPWETADQSHHKKAKSFDQSVSLGCEYENVTIRIPESSDKNGISESNSVQIKGTIEPSPQHIPRAYKNVNISSSSNSVVSGPSNHRTPVPTTAAPPPPEYADVGLKSTLFQSQTGGEYEEVRFMAKPPSKASTEDGGYISDDDTLFGKEGPPGLQAVIYANFGPDEGNKLMSLEELERHVSSKGVDGLAEEYLKIKNEPLNGSYATSRYVRWWLCVCVLFTT